MLVSYRHEFAYVQIPGVGIPAVADTLYCFCEQSAVENWQHRALKSIGFRSENALRGLKQQLSPKLFRSLFKFTVVRNPWDLLVAFYQRIIDDSNNRWHRRVGHMPFCDFVEFASHHRIGAQLERISGHDGELLVDYVARFESIAEDCGEIQRRLGIVVPSGVIESRAADYRSFYNEELVARVSRLYARDIDAFGYRFDSGATRSQPAQLRKAA